MPRHLPSASCRAEQQEHLLQRRAMGGGAGAACLAPAAGVRGAGFAFFFLGPVRPCANRGACALFFGLSLCVCCSMQLRFVPSHTAKSLPARESTRASALMGNAAHGLSGWRSPLLFQLAPHPAECARIRVFVAVASPFSGAGTV